MPEPRHWRGLGAAVLAAVLAIALTSPLGNDYAQPACAAGGCNDAAPAIAALVDLDLGRFASEQSAMGPVSLIVRAPFAAAAEAAGGGTLWQYRLGLLPSLLAAGALGLALAAAARRRGMQPPIQWAIGLGAVANPFTISAVTFGHPEEVLAASLAIGAALAALGRRHGWAAVLLGLAVGTKAIAILVFIPVLLAAGRGSRLRVGLAAAVLAAAIVAPIALADRARFSETARTVAQSNATASTFNVWWPLSEKRLVQVETAGGQGTYEERWVVPAWIGRYNRPIIVAFALLAALAFAARRRGLGRAEVLGLIGLVMLVRCMLDPLDNSYYHLTAAMAIAAWELLARDRPPVAAAALMLGASAMHGIDSSAGLNAAYLGLTVPLAVYLAVGLAGGSRIARSAAPGAAPAAA